MDPLRNIPRFSELSGQLLRLSTVDRGSYARLTSVSDIQQWTRAKADEYHQFALALLAIHNLAAPIHCLPTEVLERIFAHCWHDRKSLRLSHVCGLWRSIIFGRAAFWADAVTNCGPLFDNRQVVCDELPFVDALLSRSARHSHGIKPFFHGFSPNIVKSLTPYTSNVVSLRVTLNSQSDLYHGLWPVLCSGMRRLDAIHIELKKRVADMRDDDYDDDDEDSMLGDHLEWDLDEVLWGPLTVLSRKHLPQLARLTCPPSITRLFSGVPLRNLKIVGGCGSHYLDEDDAPRLHLEPYRKSLETLEIVGEVMWDVARPAEAAPLQLPSLRYLRIHSHDQEVICATLSWLALSQTARIHFTDGDDLRHPDFKEFFSSDSSAVLRAVIATVDRVFIHCTSFRLWLGNDSIVCFAGDAERLRMEHYHITPDSLLDVFGQSVPVTHLTLSLTANDSLEVDFRAFPHLVHLAMTGPELDTMARTLGSTDKPRGRAAQRAAPPALCPSLAELVINFGLAVQPVAAVVPKPSKGRPASLRSGSRADPNPDVDKVFGQKCTILQQVLACRASSGTRLTSLVLCIRPATMLVQRFGVSQNSAGEGSAEADLVWPSPATRQSVLESFKELVDGPVVIKLLNQAGGEVSVDKVEV